MSRGTYRGSLWGFAYRGRNMDWWGALPPKLPPSPQLRGHSTLESDLFARRTDLVQCAKIPGNPRKFWEIALTGFGKGGGGERPLFPHK